MPSSQPTLKAKIAARDRLLAQKDAELVAQAAEILTLKMQVSAIEAVVAMQNGAMDDMGKLIELMPGGLVARLAGILERHGVRIHRPSGGPFQ